MGYPAFKGLELDDLEAARPLRGANSLLDRHGRDGKVIARGELNGGGDGESDVAVLMGTVERRCDFDGGAEGFDVIGALLPGFSDGSCRSKGSMRERHVGYGADSADAQLGGDFAENLVGIGMLRQRNHGAAGAENAGFFAGDGGDGGAEPFGVVERDIGDDGEERIDDVGGVEAAAYAHFEDRDVDASVGEVEKGHGGEGLEEARKLG